MEILHEVSWEDGGAAQGWGTLSITEKRATLNYHIRRLKNLKNGSSIPLKS